MQLGVGYGTRRQLNYVIHKLFSRLINDTSKILFLQHVFSVMYTIKYIRDDNVPAQIEEGLYLGSIGAAKSKSILKSLRITHVLTVASSLPPAYPNDFTYKIVDVSDRDNVNIAQYFDDCINFIDEAKRMGGVLVHCFVGRSRSVTIVVAYLMKKYRMRLQEALKIVKSKRTLASPNSGFMSQLQNLEKSIQGSCRLMYNQ